MEQLKPVHIKCINCNKKAIAKNVLMPGDPLRAKYIAEKFLKNAKLVTKERNMYGYTGTYKGKPVTIMGSGMGMPSMSIYAFELFYFFNVEKVIRIGTCGTMTEGIDIASIILANESFSLSNFAYNYDGTKTHIEKPSSKLNKIIEKKAKENDIELHKGTILTSDVFGPYINMSKVLKRIPKNVSPIAEEMEAYALFHIAKIFKRDAAALLMAVNSISSGKLITKKEKDKALDEMILLALDSII